MSTSLAGERTRVRVLGVPVDVKDMPETLAWVADRVRRRSAGSHLCVNAANVIRARDDPGYGHLLERCDVIGVDGQPVVWAARLLRQPRLSRVTGIDLMEQVLRRARDTGWRVFLLGARPHVVARLASRVAASGVTVAGYHHGYFPLEQSDAVAADVVRSGADVLFVGMPSPAKERFVVDHAVPAGVPVAVGVGGSFDVLAGELVRAPRTVQRIGLEWLFRMVQEPRRLFRRYAVTNTRFCALVTRAALRPRRVLEPDDG